MITYKEQFDKLTRAYISGTVNPMQNCNCFVGNLLNNTTDWGHTRAYFGVRRSMQSLKDEAERNIWSGFVLAGECSIEREGKGTYTVQEILDLEKVFLDGIRTYGFKHKRIMIISDIRDKVCNQVALNEIEEDALFAGFEAALDLLKKIHKSKGEVIDNPPVFVKRKQLADVQ